MPTRLRNYPRYGSRAQGLVDESSGVYFHMEFVWKLIRLRLHDDRKQVPFLIRLSFCLIDMLP